MATPLRYALIFLLWAMVAVIYAPLIPAALTLISPALSLTHWQALFADPQLPQALLATLVSTTIAAVGALLIALLVIVALWPWPKWQRMCARLPWLLAIPHVAFATSALLLFADGGLLYDYFPYFTPLMDKLGIGLGLTLAVKESAFLLWILAAVLSEKRLLQQVIVLDSLGYSRWQCLNWLLLPSVAPALAMAMLAIVAWSLSVVDVAIILGPGNPPTLAVVNSGRRGSTNERRTRQSAADAVTRRLRFAELSAMAQLAAHYSPRRWHSQACHTFITRHYAGEFFTLNRCAVCGSAGDPRGSVDDQ